MKRFWFRFGVIAVLLAIISGMAVSLISAQSGFGTGWTVQYFNNSELSGTPVLTQTLPGGINFNWGTGSPDPAVPAENFSARFTSVQTLIAGTYEFTLASDDGARVYIDNVLVLDRWGGRILTTDRFQVNLTQGSHTFVVEYQELVDQATVQFSWLLLSGAIVTPGQPGVIGTPIFTPGPAPTATRIPPTPLPPIPPGALTGTVIRAQVLLVRQQPFFAAPVVGRVLRGQTYQVLGRDPDTQWFLLQLSGFQGWVWGYYLFVNGNEFNAPIVGGFVTQGDPAAGSSVVIQTNAVLRLRAEPNTFSTQIGRIPWGDILPVIGRSPDGGWYQVVFRGTIGWVAVPYVTIVEGDLNTVPVR